MNNNLTETLTDCDLESDLEIDLAGGRWEPCHAFAPEVTDSQVCGDCGWLHDDHRESGAIVRQLPVRVRPAAHLRRLAS